jgi:glycosyltransferase involved in cell wall biosynthesis
MRILHIISSGGMYGAEAVILNMSRSLRESGHHSVLGVFANSDNPNVQLHERALAEGIESHLIPCSGQVDLAVMAKIRELVKETNADVVHSHGYKADIYVYLSLRKTGTPCVSTCHTWYDNNLLVTFYGVVDRLVLRRYSGVVAVSDEVKQRLLESGVRKNNIYLINNGIDTRPFDSAAPTLRGDGPDMKPTVGLVGRLSTEKGVDLFLHAAAAVSSVIPEAVFLVIGDGPDRAQLELLIDSLNLRGRAFLLGRRDDMPSVYASLDVMVSASRKEGLPIAILEGMASRRALIATAVGEVPTIIQHGYTGILIPSEDSNAISEAIIKLLEDDASRDRMGTAARRSVEDNFSAKRMTDDYLRVYEKVAAGDRNSMRPDSRGQIKVTARTDERS